MSTIPPRWVRLGAVLHDHPDLCLRMSWNSGGLCFTARVEDAEGCFVPARFRPSLSTNEDDIWAVGAPSAVDALDGLARLVFGR